MRYAYDRLGVGVGGEGKGGLKAGQAGGEGGVEGVGPGKVHVRHGGCVRRVEVGPRRCTSGLGRLGQSAAIECDARSGGRGEQQAIATARRGTAWPESMTRRGNEEGVEEDEDESQN